MKNKISIVVLLFYLIIIAGKAVNGQTNYAAKDDSTIGVMRCGTPNLSNEEVLKIREQVDRWTSGRGPVLESTTIVIPVAFHIIRTDNGSADVMDQQLHDQIDVLNSSYSNTNFQFSLLSIDRTDNTLWSTHSRGSTEEQEMKQSLAVDPASTLNFYLCEDPKNSTGLSVLGYATFPWDYSEASFMHGVVCVYTSLPGGSGTPYDEGDTGTHEIGHYLGLYHTFQGGCTPPGDDIDDTPFEASAAYGCPGGLDTCPQEGEDPIHNFMDYTDDACMYEFTQGQSLRMTDVVSTYKPVLFGQTNLSPYPIIFVHGLKSFSGTWSETGENNDILDYLQNAGLTNGGNINITLDYVRSSTTLMNTINEDVHLFNGGYSNGDYYTVNFDVHSLGFPGIFETPTAGITSAFVSSSATQFNVDIPVKFRIDDIVRVNNEFMRVTDVGPDYLAVERGILGSTPETHVFQNIVWDLSLESNQASIAKQGYGIKMAVDEVKNITGAEKVILVGHSMGGLAAREYIRSNYYGDDVAKLLTIGTPHLGSRMSEFSSVITNLQGFDDRSDAIRDLLYTYGGNDGNPEPPFGNIPDDGVFLFGGFENYPLIVEDFYSKDFNADGDENDFISGISFDLSTLPSSIDYTWIVSQWDNWGPNLDGDGAVRLYRQFPWVQYISGTQDPMIEIGDTLMTNKIHTDEPKDFYSLIRGLDEPDSYELAYEILNIDIGRTIKGFITYQPNDFNIDVDFYKIQTQQNGGLNVSLAGLNSEITQLAILDGNQNTIDFTTSFPANINIPVTPGLYYVRVRGLATSDKWQYPYTLSVNFSLAQIIADFQASPLSGEAPLTVQFTDISTSQNTTITNWEWDFNNDGTIDSYEQNPTRFFGTPGTYTVSLTVSDGILSDTETKTDYITVDPEVLPNTTQIEYFFDSDPGLGNGVAIPITAGNEVTVQTTIDVSGLSIGLHRLYIRAKDENGKWGIPQSKTVLIQSTDADDPLPNVSQVEYFFDSDPGQGSGASFSITPGTIVTISDNIDLSAMQTGLHRLYVRAKHETGEWGIPQSRSLLVQATDADDPLPNVSSVEYFFDADPGLGVGTPLNITPGTEVEISDNLDLSSVVTGLHRFYVRAKDENEQWGIPQGKTVLVQKISPSDPLPNVTHVEYFFDADPGFGAGNSLSLTPDDTVEINANLPLNTLSLGDHTVYVRAQDANNFWGIPQFHAFSIVEFLVFTDVEAAAFGTPIYFNEGGADPGDGHAIDMTFTSLAGSGNVTVQQTNQTPANLLNNVSLNYTWDITKDVAITAFTAELTFHYQDFDLIGLTESNLVAAYYDDVQSEWLILQNYTLDEVNNELTVHNLDHFTIFAIGEPEAFRILATVDVKIFLEGPFASGSMSTTLLTSGFIPLTQPFSGEPWNYAGTENVSTIPDGVVDWVLIELRSDISANSAVAFRAAFLKSDGSIVDLDGGSSMSSAGSKEKKGALREKKTLLTETPGRKNPEKAKSQIEGSGKAESNANSTTPPGLIENSASPVKFDIAAGDYYICIHHRNHLSVMSATAHTINSASALYDFTASLSSAYTGGSAAMKNLGGVYGLFSSDANGDGQVTSSDFNVFNPAAKTAQTGYHIADWNLDGQVTSSDFNIFNPNARNAARTQVPGIIVTSSLRIKKSETKEDTHVK